jgi:MscS family membrane protein
MKLCFVTTFVSGVLILLHTLGVRMQAIITVISLSGVAIGISSRDLVASFFGAIFIYTNGPFSIGDRIKINGFEGIVENITWLSTRLRLDNKNLTYIPNIQFLNATVENASYALERRTTLFISVFNHDYHLINSVIEEMINAIREFEIQFEDSQYNPKVSSDLLEADEKRAHFKIHVYFDKYITKYELSLQKHKISQLIINTISNCNMRFNLRLDD